MKNTWLIALLSCALLVACDDKKPAPSPNAPPQVSISTGAQTGTLTGARDGAVEFFKGVPYAAAPVGDLRWRPPQAAPAESAPRDASKYGPDCAQEPFQYDAAPSRNGFSENCLFLNVWRPTGLKADAKLPVMVWIHGGGFTTGGTTPAVYDGSHFADKGVVFVSINYRLGRFGFFAFPALTAEHPEEMKGNYGYMDQIAALEWIHRNIAAFGGDPDNVMVFGESAGGGAVHMLLTTPLAKGLFNKAGIESGGGRGNPMGPRRLSETVGDRPSGETVGVNFAKANGIEGTGPEALAALRALSADKIVGGLSMMSEPKGPPTYSGPMLDGQIVTSSLQEAYLAKRENAVPLIIGSNDADLGFADVKTLDEAIAGFGADKETARKLYDPNADPDQHIAIASIAMDKGMTEPARFVAQTLAAHGTPVYLFRFAYVAADALKNRANDPFAKNMLPGAPHASEIPYLFDTLKDALATTVPADEAMAKAANTYWVNFAKTGNPNGAGLPEWPAYNAQDDALMILAPDGPKGMRDPWGARLDFIAKQVGGK